MFDIFYSGKKPGLFAHERAADSIEHAQSLSRTRFFWWVSYLCDYTNWDWFYEPPPWQAQQNHVWPSQWHQYSGTYLIPKDPTDQWNFHTEIVQLKADHNNWTILHPIYEDRFDWTWNPHPLDPPYIYVWGNQHWPGEKMPTVEYHVEGATERKYMDTQATLRAVVTNWVTPELIDPASVDYSWVPDPQDPPYIYEFATQWQPNGGAVYHVPGATERKYVGIQHRRLSDPANWTIPEFVDAGGVDMSWHPDNTEFPYIYEFATQWQPNGGAVYTVPGATERKYVGIQHRRLPNKAAWDFLEAVASFDYSWHPDNTEQPYTYVFGNQHWPATIMPTVTYTVSGATQQKFMDVIVAKLSANQTNWELCEDIDTNVWDWTWVPNPKDPPYIYVWGNQWNPPEYKASIKYVVPGATEVKYMDQRTVRLPRPELFRHNIAVSSFDYSWEPNPFDPPMTYVFGNQWNPAVLEPTVIYHAGGNEIKYVDDIIATVAQDVTAWELLDDIAEFDYSWRPNPTDPEYIYVFGNQWLTPEQRPALQYRVGSATTIKYMSEPRALRVGSPHLFTTHYDCEFDYSWEPDPGSPPYIYVFGNQWYSAERMPTVEYVVPGATEHKYMTEPVARLTERHDNHWHTLADCTWDYSWRPDPGDPPFIYVFGNQHWPAVKMPTVEYHVEGATERKYMDEPMAQLVPNETLWSVPEEVDRSNIDFSWVPDPGNEPYIYHFGTEYQSSVGLTYTVPGATNIKFEGDIPRLQKEKKAVQVQDIFYMDRSNALSAVRFKQLQERYPHIQKIRYVNSIQDTIKRCLNKTKQNRFWVIGSENDYSEFDFAWHAQPWQSSMTHVFGSQWNKWSDTFLINRWEFERHAKWAKNIEEFPNLNFVSDQRIHAPADAHDIYVVDFGNKESADVVANLENRYRVVKKARYFDNYLDTLKRLLDGVTAEHVWVVGSVCDYTAFDFSWQPEAWQRDMLHVFPSNEQKFGDTFFVPVRSLQAKIAELELLDWFETVNYCTDQTVPRWPMPVVQHTEDSHVDVIREHKFTAPLALFTDQVPKHVPTVSLWRDRSKTIVPLNPGAGTVIVPQVAATYIKTQLYDYPYIDKSYRNTSSAAVQDVVFISYDEPEAEQNWKILKDRCPRAIRVHGVAGMELALEAAANASTTPWFFAVFAKTQLHESFDFSFVPDRMQRPKHYIFDCHNVSNNLEYGHMGVVLYNCQGVRDTNQTGNFGLDYTLSFPHESVPLLSCYGDFATTPYHAWRTAFRETAKLAYFEQTQPSVDNHYRLGVWLTQAQGKHAAWVLKGAQDGNEFYKSTNNDLTKLKQSFRWEWLREYFVTKYGSELK